MVENGNGNSEEGFLPLDLLINILKRVRVKSLIRFKCVSKDWANLLESPYFSEQQLHHSSHKDPFLLLQWMRPLCWFYYCSFLLAPDLSVHDIDLTTLRPARIVASCNGLLCLKHLDHTLSLFNPATRQIKQVPQTLTDIKPIYYPGFGFSPLVNDYKIVGISACAVSINRAQVYSLTTGYWKEIDAVNLRTLSFVHPPVTANGAIFWLATMISDPDSHLVASFDIGLEVFTLLKGPSPSPSPSPHYSHSSGLAVYYDKLAMFRRFVDGKFDLWVLEDAPTGTVSEENWIKMYSVSLAGLLLYPVSIWRDEIVCLQLCRFSGELQHVPSIFNPYTSELKKLLPPHIHWNSSFNYVESLVTVFSTEEVKNKKGRNARIERIC